MLESPYCTLAYPSQRGTYMDWSGSCRQMVIQSLNKPIEAGLHSRQVRLNLAEWLLAKTRTTTKPVCRNPELDAGSGHASASHLSEVLVSTT